MAGGASWERALRVLASDYSNPPDGQVQRNRAGFV